MSLNRVVITGTGAVSPYGIGVPALIEGLWSGRSAVRDMGPEWLDIIPGMQGTTGAPLAKQLESRDIPRRLRRSMGPVAQMAFVACEEAVTQANLPPELLSSGRAGISFASTMGSTGALDAAYRQLLEKRFIEDTASSTFFQIMSHTCAANLAQGFAMRGRVLSPDAACASATLATGLAFEMLQSGKQDIMLCGGAEELHAVVAGCFELVQANSCRYNHEPHKTPRPFDRDRDGTVCGEGAGVLVLETLESAQKRGAEIFAEIIGFATNVDGANLAQSGSESVATCILNGLDNAGLLPDAVKYVNAHGTGTLAGDSAEARAVAEVFGKEKVPVSSLKGHIGHTLGASGALEIIGSLDMMRKGRLLPTRNLDNIAEDCEGVDFLTSERMASTEVCVKNSFAFGGINSVLVIRKFHDAQ